LVSLVWSAFLLAGFPFCVTDVLFMEGDSEYFKALTVRISFPAFKMKEHKMPNNFPKQNRQIK